MVFKVKLEGEGRQIGGAGRKTLTCVNLLVC